MFDTEKDHYEPKKIASAFNNNYIQYESMGDEDKILSVKEYINVIRPYLSDIINNHKVQGKWRIHSHHTITEHETQGEWKIHLTMAIDFIYFKDFKNQIIHFKIDNTEIMMGSETDEVIKELFESLLQRYQELLEESKNASDLGFDSVDALYYNLKLNSPEWLKNKKATTNPKNNDDKCFQYALAVALNYQNIKNNPERISKIKFFIDQYNWKEINFPSQKKTGRSLN